MRNGANMNRNVPKHNVCSFCGRNAHKVGVRYPTRQVNHPRPGAPTTVPEHVAGYCPKCWGDDSKFGARAQSERSGGVVIFDNRKIKKEAS